MTDEFDFEESDEWLDKIKKTMCYLKIFIVKNQKA